MRYSYIYTPPKTNMNTQNDGLEKVVPFYRSILGIYVKFQGGKPSKLYLSMTPATFLHVTYPHDTLKGYAHDLAMRVAVGISWQSKETPARNKALAMPICARVDQLPLFPYNRGWSSTQ